MYFFIHKHIPEEKVRGKRVKIRIFLNVYAHSIELLTSFDAEEENDRFYNKRCNLIGFIRVGSYAVW